MGSTDELEVPMAWLWAEYAAEGLIARTGSPLPSAIFEFRAARDVLALTMLFTGIADRAHDLSIDQLELVRDLVCAGGPWLTWCDSRLDAADTAAPSVRLARQAWHWLLMSRLLPAPRQADPAYADRAAQRFGAGCRIGLEHARRIVDTCLTSPPR
jgi:hypothetical protein